jgi:hypothetical protein
MGYCSDIASSEPMLENREQSRSCFNCVMRFTIDMRSAYAFPGIPETTGSHLNERPYRSGLSRNRAYMSAEQNDERDMVMTNNSNEIRLRYLYRKLVLEGKAVLSFESAKKLIGPDCAFHLYANIDSKKTKRKH